MFAVSRETLYDLTLAQEGQLAGMGVKQSPSAVKLSMTFMFKIRLAVADVNYPGLFSEVQQTEVNLNCEFFSVFCFLKIL